MRPVAPVVAVRGCPQGLPWALRDMRSVRALTVISVPTPDTTDRTWARKLVRDALQQTLGALLGQPAASVALVSRPGEAIAVDSPLMPLGLSVSHAPELSIAAICRNASVGIDLMRLQDGMEADANWLGVARDYLGPHVAAGLQVTAPADYPVAFTQAWTRFEAGLKCLGLALTEWSPELAQQLATCQTWALDFAANPGGLVAVEGNFVGSVAVRAQALPPLHPLHR